MAFSLYDATVANYLQILGSVGGYLDKSLTHFKEKGVDPAKMVEAKLAPTCCRSVSRSSRSRIIRAAPWTRRRTAWFSPPSAKPDLDFAGLQSLVSGARDELSALKPDAVNALVGRDVTFKLGDRALPFTAEGFLMSFSLPNFFFHATTAYGILRNNGAPLGKRDFIGRLNLKG